MNQIAYMAHNFNCRIETEGLLKVTGSHICCESESIYISEMVQDRDVATRDS